MFQSYTYPEVFGIFFKVVCVSNEDDIEAVKGDSMAAVRKAVSFLNCLDFISQKCVYYFKKVCKGKITLKN